MAVPGQGDRLRGHAAVDVVDQAEALGGRDERRRGDEVAVPVDDAGQQLV